VMEPVQHAEGEAGPAGSEGDVGLVLQVGVCVCVRVRVHARFCAFVCAFVRLCVRVFVCAFVRACGFTLAREPCDNRGKLRLAFCESSRCTQ
jgi:hypothetical protein